MTDDETHRLTAAMAAGDAAAVDAFCRHYGTRLYALARQASRRDESFCLDVVQEATLRIVRTIRPVDAEPQLLAWLRLVVRTTALDLLRRERRRAARENNAVFSTAAIGSADDERLCWLQAQIARFDPELVRIVEWRYDHGWTLRRIAEGLGLSVGTVDGRLRRALAGLRERATEVFDDE